MREKSLGTPRLKRKIFYTTAIDDVDLKNTEINLVDAYSPFMPFGGTQGEGGCLDAVAKSGSRGWAPRAARRSALRSPVQKRTMDWVIDELISNMADHKGTERRRQQKSTEDASTVW